MAGIGRWIASGAELIIMTKAAVLYREIDALLAAVLREGNAQVAAWAHCLGPADFRESALNLAHYLALRRRDLRDLQRPLMRLGLSSLGRSESRVVPTLLAVRAALAALTGLAPEEGPSDETFFAGEQRLAERTRELLGASASSRAVALLVTCPTEAAEEPSFMQTLAEHGVEAVRINCAHDDADHWRQMIEHVRAAERATGRRLIILMDLAGPKIRTGAVRLPAGQERIGQGAMLTIVPPGGLGRLELDDQHFAVECTLPEALSAIKAGDRLFIDDGKLGAEVERVEACGVLARVTSVVAKGIRLKAEKGLNFPDTELNVAALTDKDRTDLDFIAAHADGIEFSFVQSVADVKMLQDALAERRPRVAAGSIQVSLTNAAVIENSFSPGSVVNISPETTDCPQAGFCAGRRGGWSTRWRGRAIPEPWRYRNHGTRHWWRPWPAMNAHTGR
jgi:pyruvate kinase